MKQYDISAILQLFVHRKLHLKGKTKCSTCNGKRLRPEASYVKINGIALQDLVTKPLDELANFFATITLNEYEKKIAKRLLLEINNRLSFLMDVGLSYLTLNRKSNTLSGGESQRINLATSLGSSLVGSMYILDEPSIGLHPKDTEKLIGVLKSLRDLGNTVIVVEHDLAVLDYLSDFGLRDRLDFQIVGEALPKIKSPDDKSWSGISLPWMSIGYELELTPLHILTFYNGVANNGRMIKGSSQARPLDVHAIIFLNRYSKTIGKTTCSILNGKSYCFYAPP